MYLSYSGFKSYVQCPYSYWHKYVNKTTLLTPENTVNSLYGSTVGILFEGFYADKLWRSKDYESVLQSRVEETFDKAVKDQRGRIVDWNDEKANYHSRAELLADVRETIPRGLQIIRENRLIGPQADAEVKLDSKFGPHLVGGRADFIIRRVEPHKDLVILDGKGSKWGGKFVEDTQLKWYAVLHRARLNVVPDALGFVFWRFEGEKAITWVKFTSADLDVLQHEILTTMNRVATSIDRLQGVSGKLKAFDELRQELFPAQAGDNCRLCAYADLCEEGKAKVAEPSRRKPRVTLPQAGVVDDGLCLDDE